MRVFAYPHVGPGAGLQSGHILLMEQKRARGTSCTQLFFSPVLGMLFTSPLP